MSTAPGSSAALPKLHPVIGWYALALLVIALDQITKVAAEHYLSYARPLPVTSWFNLTLQYNPGAAFSFLSDAGGWQRYFFSGIAMVISVVLVVWLYRLPSSQRLLPAALALILGGAIGNLWDRLVLGHVVDFISLHYAGAFFPAFNIADSAITVGAALMILDSFLAPRQAAQTGGTGPQ
tara:strand:+ start:4874 stop:5413 length:540 start_codon:yes stop_codon:yes gene_type:complete